MHVGGDYFDATSATQLKNTTTDYQHQVPIYLNLERKGADRHSQYMTFRTVSASSAPGSWMYPKKPANPIMQSVANVSRGHVERILSQAYAQDVLASLGA